MIADEPITLHVAGVPAPQGSKKHVGGGRMVESSRALKPWRKRVRDAAAAAAEVHGTIADPVHVDVLLVLPRPKRSKFTRPAGPPDLDKLQRAVGDGLEAGGIIANDSRIVSWHATKAWSRSPGGATGAVITISLAESADLSRWGHA